MDIREAASATAAGNVLSWVRQRRPEGDGVGRKAISLSLIQSLPPRNSRVPWQWRPPQPPPITHERSRQSANTKNEQTTYRLLGHRTSTTAPPPMPCAKTDVRLSEDPAAGGSGVDPIAAILRQRPSSPDIRGELGFKAKEEGSMAERRRREG